MSAWATAAAARDGAGDPLVVGHRGGRGPGWPPENTMAAFEQARAQGARAIELDVRTSRDGGVVVFHDPTLERMTAKRDRRSVSDVSRPDLARIDLGGGEKMPTLSEVLGWARRREVAVNVEMKHDVADRRVLARETIREVRESGADVLLSSFDPWLLSIAAVLAPSVGRALLTYAKQPRWADAVQAAARRPFVRAVHLERVQASPGAVAAHAGRGLRVGVWTVNDPMEARTLVGFGAASIITDTPGAVLAALTPAGAHQ